MRSLTNILVELKMLYLTVTCPYMGNLNLLITILLLNPNLVMTNCISLERSKTPK